MIQCQSLERLFLFWLLTFNREFYRDTHRRYFWIIGLNPDRSVVILGGSEAFDRIFSGTELDFDGIQRHGSSIFRLSQRRFNDALGHHSL